MKFHELSVGEKFKFNNLEFTKIPEERVSCCKVKWNGENVSTGEKIVFKPLDEVEKVVVVTPENN